MGLSNFFNSLFGKAKKTAEEASENVTELTDQAMDKASEIAYEVKEKVERIGAGFVRGFLKQTVISIGTILVVILSFI